MPPVVSHSKPDVHKGSICTTLIHSIISMTEFLILIFPSVHFRMGSYEVTLKVYISWECYLNLTIPGLHLD